MLVDKPKRLFGQGKGGAYYYGIRVNVLVSRSCYQDVATKTFGTKIFVPGSRYKILVRILVPGSCSSILLPGSLYQNLSTKMLVSEFGTKKYSLRGEGLES